MLLIFVATACEQDYLVDEASIVTPKLNTVYFDINDLTSGAKSTDGKVPHTLGPERQNPLTVANLNLAEAQIKGNGGTHAVTDLYLKFQPVDAEDLIELEEADLFLLDFPWTKELIEKGDYYQSGKDSTDYPDLYTTMSVNATIPNVPYVVLASLDLSQTDPVIIKKAFDLTGNGQEFIDTYGPYGNEKKICLSNEEGEILACEGDDGGGVTSQFITNDCGCEIYANQRKPGGTIKVDDTQFNADLPVRRVRVVAKNGWFTWRRADTDDNGCWRINRAFSGKAWFWVKFKDTASDRVKMRFSGVRGWRFWQKAFTAKVYLGRIAGPNFHDIQTRFGRWDGNQIGTKVHYSWAGATVNNALHEFHDFAGQEGFIPPPDDLNLMVNLGQTRGLTIMLRKMGVSNFLTAVNHGVGFWAPNAVGFTLNDDFGRLLVNATGSIAWPQPSPVLNTFLGDVNTGGAFTDSDRMKRLAYHEIGHSSHYEGTSILYWRRVIAAEIGAFGHGDPTVNFAGHIQIAESWAEHMAVTMVKQQYPVASVLDVDGNTVFDGDWALTHEVVSNESQDHIPIGIFNDLMDGVNLNESVRNKNSSTFTTLIDPVQGGYSNALFAQKLNSSIRSPADFRQLCLSNLPSGVSENDVNVLFSEY